ncbi:MAG: hypothetical protein ACOH1Q_11195 [Thiobacillus sp.]
MPFSPPSLNAEHMKPHTLHDDGSETAPQRSWRRHTWRVWIAALAILSAFLLLNGCEKQGVAEQAGAQVDEAARGMNEPVDTTNQLAPPQAGPVDEMGRSLDKPVEHPGEIIEPMGDAMPNQQKPMQ